MCVNLNPNFYLYACIITFKYAKVRQFKTGMMMLAKWQNELHVKKLTWMYVCM